MVQLASNDEPDVLCLQELPLWSLGLLDDWSGMTAVADPARRAVAVALGRTLTDLNHGLFRSAFTGQGNAILLRDLPVVEHRRIPLNPFKFRRSQARKLRLGLAGRLAWARERRVCQAVRVRRNGGTLVIANLHATNYPPDRRLPDVELLRAAVFTDGFAQPDEPIVLCGDFNVSIETSSTIAELTKPEWGFTGPTHVGVDHVLVRGLPIGSVRRWPAARRMRAGRLLSDHAPVELEVG